MTLLEFNPITLIDASLHMREIVNGALAVMCGNLAIILAWFMARTWWECHNTGCVWHKIEGIQSACVMMWIMGIISFRSAIAWMSLHLNTGGINQSTHFQAIASWGLVLSATILAAVTLRGTYIWTPPKIHHRAWLFSASVTALFLLASEYLA